MIPVLPSLPISSTQRLVPVSAVAGLQRPLLSVSVVGAVFVAGMLFFGERSWDSRGW